MMDSHSQDMVEHEGLRTERAFEEDRFAGRIGEQVRRALHDILKSPETLRQAIVSGTHEHQLSRRVANGVASGALTALLAAGGVGFGRGWLSFGQQGRRTGCVARRMSHSSERMI